MERFSETKDPDDIKPYTFRINLPQGETPTSATVAVVTAAGTDAIGSDVTPGAAAAGQIAGQLWGATFTPLGGSVGSYLLRCRWVMASGKQFDQTLKLFVEIR